MHPCLAQALAPVRLVLGVLGALLSLLLFVSILLTSIDKGLNQWASWMTDRFERAQTPLRAHTSTRATRVYQILFKRRSFPGAARDSVISFAACAGMPSLALLHHGALPAAVHSYRTKSWRKHHHAT